VVSAEQDAEAVRRLFPGRKPPVVHVYGPDDVIAKALSAEPIEKGGRLTDTKRKKLRAKRRGKQA